MTKLLDEAIAKVRELPEEEQECAAESLMVFASSRSRASTSSRRRSVLHGDCL